MDNYAVMLNAAKARFCTYDTRIIERKNGVFSTKTHIITTFLGEPVAVEKATGEVQVGGRPANFGEGLTIFDWLCDRKENARASYDFCPVSSLPGVLVSGGTLVMNFPQLAAKIDKAPDAFLTACRAMGAVPTDLGDLGMQLMVFPDLPLQLKFYHSDEEFPPSLTLLWDKNTLQFIRYETVYYLAGCLRHKLEKASPWGEAVSKAD